MRLLLDEMYPHAIAEQLRTRGHDVDAVTERPELRNVSDRHVFEVAQQERRAIVTENVRDFIPITNECAARAETHFGLILVDASKYQRGAPRTLGRMVVSLEKFLTLQPSNLPTSLIHWL